jgi:hypothetical protein
MKFLKIYKTTYLAAIVANALWTTIELGHVRSNLDAHVIAAVFFVGNVVAWVGYQRGKPWGLELEQILSGGRMLMVLAGSTVFAADLVAWLSPIGWIFWYKLMSRTIPAHLGLYWCVCAVLLGMEGLYMYLLVHVPEERSAAVSPPSLSMNR